MTGELRDDWCWPSASASEAIAALAEASGLAVRSVVLTEAPAGIASNDEHEFLGAWIDEVAGCMGLETDWLVLTYNDCEHGLRDNGPFVLAIEDGPGGSGTRLLAVVRGRRDRLEIVTPGRDRIWIAADGVCARLRRKLEASVAPQIDRLFAAAELAADHGARRAMLRARLGARAVGLAWTLDVLPGAGVRTAARRAGLGRSLGALVGARLGEYALLLLGWWFVGHGALGGAFDRGWLWAWALAFAGSLALRVLAMSAEGELALRGGVMVRRRLLAGALRLEPEEVRSEGAGQLLGRVIEAEALETLSFSGGMMALVAAIELALAGGLLGLGAGGGLHAALLALWIGCAVVAGIGYLRRLRAWTALRLDMTSDLVERMAGHATRLAQQHPARFHEGEDPQLARYIDASTALDRRAALLQGVLPRGWMLLGIAGLAPQLITAGATRGGLATALGGVLLAFGAFQRLSGALPQLAGAAVAWRQVRDMFRSAEREPHRAAALAALVVTPRVASERVTTPGGSATWPDRGTTLIEARDLVFRYRAHGQPVLAGCDVRLSAGDRLLLEGPSGGGKSTLAALLAGLREPESGLLLLQGLDHRSVGSERWRRRVAAAPQFHENHIMSGTLLFNLLLGRRWPPRLADRREAKAVCRELGLGPLLEQMPAGFDQMVGETGWQLSHGERSRVCLARALLQGADLIVLDESFAALDPQTLRVSLECAIARARTLLVITHP